MSTASSPNGVTSGTNLNTSDANSSNIEGGYSVDILPGMTEYWIPNCEDGIKPKIGMTFSTLDAVVSSYKNYAAKVGFDIRSSSVMKSNDEVILSKYILCSREGYKNVIGSSTLNVDEASSSSTTKRRRVSNRTGCKARIVFKFIGSFGYVVKKFEKRHNHCMSSILAKQFLKVNRNIDVGHQKFIANCARANIGPTKSFNLYKEMVGDFSNKKEVCEAFYFAYDIDEDEHLCKLFWADPISRKNFGCFGDVVCFDATYQTNRYDMVFTSFTGIDNHKKSITFATGLLTKEDIASYVWLFEHFKKAMGAEPKVVVTDQDPAMRQAIPAVFNEVRHHFWMWHIMCKVGEKVGSMLSKNENFRKKLNSVVWSSYLEPLEFENEWRSIMEEFDLVNNNWFVQMFELRRFWIPAYFRDVPMAGLLRTTSRSEGENGVFSRFTTPLSSLVQFYMQFERALDSQRHNHAKLTSDSEGNIPEMKTPLPIEKHASTVYTLSIFCDIQKEICTSCFNCRVLSVREDGDILYYEIKDGSDRKFTVEHNVTEKKAKYVLNRWTKDASLKPIFHIDGLTFDQGAGMDERKVLLAQLWGDMQCCIGLAEEAKMDKLVEFARD
ncbi:protein FAR1-RELATED SEQUENCE 5-like [Ipomoea triloba]|uniref:protein FAR1-RELATED SEQUENCE 5-like n=1 Tax=Ipomoea triloba TaxID=35885 RepID=UPI00125E553C|nr:protein FAR1-RELATED SEQUENCE 5-like [Ipomoea triloba]